MRFLRRSFFRRLVASVMLLTLPGLALAQLCLTHCLSASLIGHATVGDSADAEPPCPHHAAEMSVSQDGGTDPHQGEHTPKAKALCQLAQLSLIPQSVFASASHGSEVFTHGLMQQHSSRTTQPLDKPPRA